MKRILIVLLVGISACNIQAENVGKDFFIRQLDSSLSKAEKLEVLTDSMDGTRGENHLYWAKRLYEEALSSDDEYYQEEALTELLRHYINHDVKDTARHYLAEAERVLPDSEYKRYLLKFMRTIMDVRVVYYQDNYERDSLMTQVLLRLKNNQQASRLEKAADYYLMGAATTSRAEIDYETKADDVIRYFDLTLQQTEGLPIRTAMLFRPNCFFQICGNAFSDSVRVRYGLRYLAMLQEYQTYLKNRKRKFTNQRHFLNAYSMLACSSETLGRAQADAYFRRFVELNRRYPEDANFTPTYEYLFTAFRYYSSINDKRKTLQVCDSMVTYLHSVDMGAHASQYVREKIALCDSLHLYKEGFEAFKLYDSMLAKVQKTTKAAEAKEAEIEQEVARLMLEKKTLEAEKSNMRLLFLLALFVLAVCTILYTVFYLRKTKALNKELKETNHKLVLAGGRLRESERMKYAFIRNLCNEIFTPLNAIKGFSDFLLDSDADEAERKTFLKIISEHSNQIRRMMDNILEIVRLDSNEGHLPLDWTNIHTLCTWELETLKKDAMKPGIEYKVTGNQENDVVCTNQTYLGYILGHLLNYVNRATEQGDIVVSYQLDAEAGKQSAHIYLTATGKVTQSEVKSGNVTLDDSAGTSDIALLVCEMIAGRMNAKLIRDTEFKDGLRFIIELPL